MVVTSRFLHVSIATGMMGYMFPVYGVPIIALALVALGGGGAEALQDSAARSPDRA